MWAPCSNRVSCQFWGVMGKSGLSSTSLSRPESQLLIFVLTLLAVFDGGVFWWPMLRTLMSTSPSRSTSTPLARHPIATFRYALTALITSSWCTPVTLCASLAAARRRSSWSITQNSPRCEVEVFLVPTGSFIFSVAAAPHVSLLRFSAFSLMVYPYGFFLRGIFRFPPLSCAGVAV